MHLWTKGSVHRQVRERVSEAEEASACQVRDDLIDGEAASPVV